LELLLTEPLNVDPELLIASGTLADEHSETVFGVFTASDAAVEFAQFSWVGRSHAALTATAADWTAATTGLTARIYAAGEALRVSGLAFAEQDHRGAAALAPPPPRPRPPG
jgi:uncharacterized protein YukE